MKDTIDFIKRKLKKSREAKSRYDAFAHVDCFEQVIIDGLIEEIVHYENAIEIIRAYRGYITNLSPLKKVAE